MKQRPSGAVFLSCAYQSCSCFMDFICAAISARISPVTSLALPNEIFSGAANLLSHTGIRLFFMLAKDIRDGERLRAEQG